MVTGREPFPIGAKFGQRTGRAAGLLRGAKDFIQKAIGDYSPVSLSDRRAVNCAIASACLYLMQFTPERPTVLWDCGLESGRNCGSSRS